jgi:hypothetical protein
LNISWTSDTLNASLKTDTSFMHPSEKILFPTSLPILKVPVFAGTEDGILPPDRDWETIFFLKDA